VVARVRDWQRLRLGFGGGQAAARLGLNGGYFRVWR
jgi:hypothetical protein